MGTNASSSSDLNTSEKTNSQLISSGFQIAKESTLPIFDFDDSLFLEINLENDNKIMDGSCEAAEKPNTDTVKSEYFKDNELKDSANDTKTEVQAMQNNDREYSIAKIVSSRDGSECVIKIKQNKYGKQVSNEISIDPESFIRLHHLNLFYP